AGEGAGAERVAWTPAKGRRGREDGERVVVLQEEADSEQCGWLFCCHTLPAWMDVAPLVVHAVRESVFYETSADPIRFSLLGLDLITRQEAPPPPPSSRSSPDAAGTPAEAAEGVHADGGGGDGDGANGGGGGAARRGVAGQDRWFFTFLLCKLLSG
ncbi:unnamed protein product, partial [Hapterophycus canaliculatus]